MKCRTGCTACWLAEHNGHDVSVRTSEGVWSATCYEPACDGAFKTVLNIEARTDYGTFDALTHELSSGTGKENEQ